MLSIESPPRDPPCPCEISQLKSGSDERASDKLEAVDLLNSGVDDNNNPLPKFSIRDYVFSTRSKDIENNWPFSQENLQLCLKHGPTEVLPPFQPLDAVRNPSQEKCNVSSILPDKENTSNSDGKPYRESDECVCVNSNAGCDRKLAGDCSNINPSGSEGEKDFPSTTTSLSSEIDSVPTIKSPSLELEDNTLLEPLIENSEAVIPPKSCKAESSNQSAVKKCKLIVKLSNLAHTSTKEDTAMNNYMVSEAMASKVCPVCKTFSSSSNTTLNAHIDQCLSGESTTKWVADSRVIKHRIKPRKMRSMVDIYTTAPHCTLEELDRRNGTNWASNSSMPLQETEICADRKLQGSSPLDSDETPNESAVYIDANGTKLRILSKFNDPSLDAKILDDPQPKKFVKGDKGANYLLAKKKKKKNQVQKQHKLLRHAPHGKKTYTSDPSHPSEIGNREDRNFSCEKKNYTKEDRMPQQLKALDKVKFRRPEMIRGWVCSKRTGLTKKSNGQDDHLRSRGCVDREIQPENTPSSPCTNLNRSSVVKIRSENSPSPTGSKRVDNSSNEPHCEYREHPSPKKKMGFSAMESQIFRHRKRSLVLQESPEHCAKHLSVDGPLNRENHSSPVSKRRIETRAGIVRNAEHSIIHPKMSSSQQALLSKSKRFSFLKKYAMSASSASDSKFYSKRKCASVKKSRMHCASERNNKAVVSQPGVDRHFMQNPSKDAACVEGTSPEESIERTRVLRTHRKEEVVTSKNSRSTPVTHHHDAGENGGPLMLSGAFACTSDAVESAGKSGRARRRDINIELPCEETVEGTFMGFSKTLDPSFHGLEDPSDTQCDSQRFIEAYEGPLFESEVPTSSAEPILSGEQEMFCTDGAAENMMGENVCGMELDSSNGRGNYFGEVDSIPIPGPPGSFLPSPGRMDSEDLHGNTSLSSSKIQSSDDHQELIDHSSESPVSTTSTISNSTLGRSDAKSSEEFSAEPPLLDARRSDFTAVAANVVDPVVENRTPEAKASDAGSKKLGVDELKGNITVPEKGPFRFRNDQPCCCSRKESSSQNVALNYQESALLRRRTMASVIMPATGKDMNVDYNGRLDNVRSANERSTVTEEAASKHTSSRVSADSEVKLSTHGNCESASPPTPSPVLRLMGKNLMVVNKDENVASQLRKSQSSIMNVHANSQAVPIPMVSTGSTQNEERHIAHQVVSQGPFFFDQHETKGFMQHPDMRWSDGFGNHGISVRQEMSPLASPAILPSRTTAMGFTGSLMHHEYTGGYHSPTQLLQPMNRSGIPMAYEMEKVVESPSLRWRSAEPPANPIKEIIIIDDTPDNEVDSTTVATHSQRSKRGVESSTSISVSRPLACDSWSMNPFHITQPYESVTYTGSPVDASFRLPPANGANANSVRWNCTPEISSAVHPSSLTPASSSTAHLRSEMYNSSGF